MPTVEIKLPRARLISGHPMKLRDSTDPITKQKKLNDQGQPKQECFIQFAIPKSDPALYGEGGVFHMMSTAAGRPFPENPAMDPTGFKWKITDGDSQHQDQKTGQFKPRADYCIGHWLFNVKSHGWTSGVVYKPTPTQPYQDVMDPSMIKTGDYFDVMIKVEPNNVAQAGIYINPALIGFNEAGGAISSGAGLSASDADKMFAGSSAQAPTQPPAPAPVAGNAPAAGNAPPAQGYQPPANVTPPAPAAQPYQPPTNAASTAPTAPTAPPAPAQQPGYQPPANAAQPAPNYDPNFAGGPTVPVTR